MSRLRDLFGFGNRREQKRKGRKVLAIDITLDDHAGDIHRVRIILLPTERFEVTDIGHELLIYDKNDCLIRSYYWRAGYTVQMCYQWGEVK